MITRADAGADLALAGAGDVRPCGCVKHRSRARPRLALTPVMTCAGRWKSLSDLEKPWFEADNGAYIYFNKGDRQWWIDEPNGSGVYVSGRATSLPPADGWKPIGSSPSPLPTVIAQ